LQHGHLRATSPRAAVQIGAMVDLPESNATMAARIGRFDVKRFDIV
jgi:hypothetical protein